MQGWWVLTDEQRVRIYEMTPDARTQAWTQIASQMRSATPTAPTRGDASPRFQSKEMVQATPAEYTAASGDNLPVCSAMQQDGCINSWAKNNTNCSFSNERMAMALISKFAQWKLSLRSTKQW